MTARVLSPWGANLTEADYHNLATRWISRDLADRAGLRRVDSANGREMFARKRGDLAGIIIPNRPPWDAGQIREYRLRLDNPELERRIDGTTRETNKYIQPPGRPSLIYFPPGWHQSKEKSTAVNAVSRGTRCAPAHR